MPERRKKQQPFDGDDQRQPMGFWERLTDIKNHLMVIAAIVTTLAVPFSVFATKDDLDRHVRADFKEDTIRELNVARQEYGSFINYQVMIESAGRELSSMEKQMLEEARKNYVRLQAQMDDIKKLQTAATMSIDR